MSLFAPPVWTGQWPGQGNIGNLLLNDNPDSAWQSLIDRLTGVRNSNNPMAQFYRSQQSPWYNRFLAGAAMGGPQDWTTFLNQYQPDIQSQYGQASSQQKGQYPDGGIGKARWVGFPG